MSGHGIEGPPLVTRLIGADERAAFGAGFHHEKAEGRWELNPAEEFASSQVTTSSVFYHRWFARIGWDINAYRLKEPGDWNRFRKFRYLGVRHARYPEPMLFHYREQNRRPENI